MPHSILNARAWIETFYLVGSSGMVKDEILNGIITDIANDDMAYRSEMVLQCDNRGEPKEGRNDETSGTNDNQKNTHHILNTPNFVASTGAFKHALSARLTTRRVSSGAMTPSSQMRAVE